MIELDGSDNKGVMGANAILGVSMAVCKAGAGTDCFSIVLVLLFALLFALLLVLLFALFLYWFCIVFALLLVLCVLSVCFII
jgi:hypothetical protein